MHNPPNNFTEIVSEETLEEIKQALNIIRSMSKRHTFIKSI